MDNDFFHENQTLAERMKIISYTPKKGYKLIYRYSSDWGDYIGQTSLSIKGRAGNYGSKYLNNNDSKWAKAIKKYGIDQFNIEILAEVPEAEADEKEKYYIAKYNSWQAGFNSTPGGKIYKCHAGDIKRIFVDLKEKYRNCSFETQNALISIFQVLNGEELKSVNDFEFEFLRLIKSLNEGEIGYSYYAMESEYATYYASPLLFCYNFDIEEDAVEIMQSFAKKRIDNSYSNWLDGYLMWYTCSNSWMYKECFGGDIITDGDADMYAFTWGKEKI